MQSNSLEELPNPRWAVEPPGHRVWLHPLNRQELLDSAAATGVGSGQILPLPQSAPLPGGAQEGRRPPPLAGGATVGRGLLWRGSEAQAKKLG